MMIFLLLIPILTLLSGLSVYRYNGKRQFLKFDLVQFVYAFVISPLLFIWMKSFIFALMRTELLHTVTLSQLFVLDSAFSLLFLYIYAFVVIHSLTKSFKMRKLVDPLYDMFYHSEYFHLWLSHVIMFGGSLLLFILFSVLNLAFAWPVVVSGPIIEVSATLGVIVGIGIYIGALLSNPLQKNFMRLMKLLFAVGFVIHISLYFWLTPDFSAVRWFYWFGVSVFTTLVVLSLVWHRSSKANLLLEKFKDLKWGLNIDLSNKK